MKEGKCRSNLTVRKKSKQQEKKTNEKERKTKIKYERKKKAGGEKW